MDNLEKLGGLFAGIVENSGASSWMNIPLGHQAFELMRDGLPLRVKGELTPYTRIMLLNKMMDCLPERDCARLLRDIKEYQAALFPLIGDEDLAEDMDMDGYSGEPAAFVRKYTVEDHRESLQRTLDYLDPAVPMESWCKRYHVMLRFDPVERSEEWEECIYEVEKELDKRLKNERKGMGFCYIYWPAKRAALRKRGIDWRDPHIMNPRVMFD